MFAALGERDRDAEAECGLPDAASRLAARKRAAWIVAAGVVLGLAGAGLLGLVLRTLRG